jgi:hypothetical protein
LPSYSALQLCNRVRLKTRGGGAFSDLQSNEAKTILDCLNTAKDYVLETRDWDFDHRHDEVVLNTVAQVSTGTVGVTAGATAFTTSASDVFTPGDYVARLIVTEDGEQPSTAVRIVSYSGTSGVLDAAWTGETNATADYKIVFYEYKLPVTVKDVTAARFQEQEIGFSVVGFDQGFRTAIPRPTDRITDLPETFVVGAQVTPTVTSGTATPGLGCLVYPCPSTVYRLDLSTKYRHPQLVGDDDELENVSDAAVHEIVNNAFALMEVGPGRDPNLAEATRLSSEMRLNRHHDMNRADGGRRKILRSLDDRGGEARSMPADPRVFYEP